MSIWNPKAIDYSAGMVKCDNGTLKADTIGCEVMTAKEAMAIIDKRFGWKR